MARVRECHYDVLGVAMDADGDVVKKAYRKLALEWHPDKNMHRVDEATERFRLISEAYQVLSDPTERAWYDSHRESILRGGDGTNHDGAAGVDFVPNVFQYFTIPRNTDFNEYYTQAFEEIVKAENEDASRQGKDEKIVWPSFGTKDAPFTEVKRFYQVWEGFVTKLSFAWMDKYDTREAENRYQRRYVEKLNDSERSAARREYNENVRSLVAFCKKRDERWALGMAQLELEEREKKERRQRAETERKAQKAAEKLALQQEIAEERRKEEEERRMRGEEEDPKVEQVDSDEEHHLWHCGVCNKEFKSEKQLANHEGSKKHKDAVKAFLKKGGKLEEVKPASKQQLVDHETEQNDETVEPCPSCGKLIPNDSQDCPLCDMPVFLGKEVPSVTSAPPLKEDDEGSDTNDDEEDNLVDFVKSKKMVEVEPDDDEEPPATIANDDGVEEDEMTEGSSAKPQSQSSGSTKKLGKAKQKRLEREARKNASAPEAPPVCTVCGEEFTSRTKLFKHVEELDHAAPLDQTIANAKATKAKGGKGKKSKS